MLRKYKKAEPHLRRPGRTYNAAKNGDDEPVKIHDVNNMQKGVWALTNGGLKKWSTKTTRSRGLRKGASNVADITIDTEDSESEEEDMWGADDNQDETDTPS